MNEEPTPACPWLASYEQALLGSERNGREKEKIPLDPLKRKREGKEIRPDSKGSGLSRGRAHAICAGVTRSRVWSVVAQTIAKATAIFHGTAKDSKLWARIAWRVGPELFSDAMRQAKSEIDAKKPLPPWSEWPRIFQNILNDRFPKPNKKGGAA